MTSITLYDQKNIDSLPWPETDEGAYAKRFLLPIIKNGVSPFFENIETKMYALLIDDLVLPITINHEEYQNSYVCSPYGQYIGCAVDQIQTLKNRYLKAFSFGALGILKPLFHKGKINQVVVVNNWLFSTNLYPILKQEQLKRMVEFLKNCFSSYSILFRSISLEELHPVFLSNHFDLIASRPVYVLDATKEEPFQARMFKSDLKILEKTDYQIIGNDLIEDSDMPRILELYQKLYFEKYSALSPRINQDFVHFAVKNNLLTLKALKKNGKIDAMAGYFKRSGWMTSPFFGYDTSLPQELGLYRMISTLVSLEAKKQKLILNQSSGARSYKKLRRAKEKMEFLAVYTKHLPWHRKLPWKILKWTMNSIGMPIMKQLQI